MIELVRDMGVTLVQSAASDEMVAMAAWVSNDADNEERLLDKKKVAGLIKFLYRNKHMSPFEHGHFTFKIDAPLFVVREFQRHRAASYNEVSGRYTEMKPRFYVGGHSRVQVGKMGNYSFNPGTADQTALYLKSKEAAVVFAWEEYQRRLEAGIAKEQAREDLPLSLMTQFYVTMNPRNLMHFLELRTDVHALKEIRDLALLMEQIFAQEMPLTFAAYNEEREKAEEDVEALKSEVHALRSNYASLKQARDASYESMVQAHAERDEAIKVRDEAVHRYNREFVAAHEPTEQPNITDDELESKPMIFDDAIDYIVPRIGEAVERLKPVYNIYVENKGELDASKIASIVDDILRKRR